MPPPPAPPAFSKGPPTQPASTLRAPMTPSSLESFRYRDGIPLSSVSNDSGEVHMVVDILNSPKIVVISFNEE